MVSFKVASILAAAASVTALNITAVPESTRTAWCSDQTNQCPLICQQLSDKPVVVNDCDAESLTYGCLCGDNIKPNMTEYSLTLPYYICTEENTQCVAACGMGANTCASNCRQKNPCGALNPTKVNSTSTASSSTTSSTAQSTIHNGLAGDDNDSAGSVSRVATLTSVLGLVVAGFAFM